MLLIIEKLKSLFEIKNKNIDNIGDDSWYDFEIDDISFTINLSKGSYYLFYDKVGEFVTPFDRPKEKFEDINQLIGFVQIFLERNKE